MKTAESEVNSAGKFAFAAARDARIKSYAESTHFTEKEKIRAERMKLILDLCYYTTGVHINFRKKFVAIKVEAAEQRDRKLLNELESAWEKEGITKHTTAQGIIYRIPAI